MQRPRGEGLPLRSPTTTRQQRRRGPPRQRNDRLIWSASNGPRPTPQESTGSSLYAHPRVDMPRELKQVSTEVTEGAAQLPFVRVFTPADADVEPSPWTLTCRDPAFKIPRDSIARHSTCRRGSYGARHCAQCCSHYCFRGIKHATTASARLSTSASCTPSDWLLHIAEMKQCVKARPRVVVFHIKR